MTTNQRNTVVGVFDDRSTAQRAVNELKQMGFTDSDIGVVSRQAATDIDHEGGDDSYVGEGAAAGLATGAGLGALWGLGIVAGVLPVIGPAIAGGTLAAILSSAAAGAAAAGIAGALVGLGMSKDEAEYYEEEFNAGRTIVTVKAGTRHQEASALLRRLGATDISDRDNRVSSASRTTATSGATAAGATSGLPTGATHSSTSALRDTGRTAATDTSASCPTPSTTSASQRSGAHAMGGDSIKATEEKLDVHKDRVEAGSVNVRKEVHTEHKTIEVPVEREEVVIERRPGSGQAAGAGMTGQQEINIPIREEEVHIEKTPVVKEEVSVGKRTVRENQTVSADLRKEEIKVDSDGDINVRDERRNR